jgi:hypothetical protein
LKKSLTPLLSRFSALKGMGGLGIGGMLLGGGALAAGAYGVSRIMAAREKLMAKALITELDYVVAEYQILTRLIVRACYAAGLNSLSLRSSRLRDMDVFGAGGASQKAVIQRAQFERNFGVEEGTLSGIGSQFS